MVFVILFCYSVERYFSFLHTIGISNGICRDFPSYQPLRNVIHTSRTANMRSPSFVLIADLTPGIKFICVFFLLIKGVIFLLCGVRS